jgi:4-amino-4-deoxy-L-arabinose transferase-like glycosyltransferase
MQLSKTQIGLVLALLISNAIVLYSSLTWSWLRFPVGLALTFVLPGWAWLPTLGWMRTHRAIERIILVVGFSSLLSALALLIALLLPGPFTEMPALLALNLTTITGLIYHFATHKLQIANRKSQMVNRDLPLASPPSPLEWPSRSILLILLTILAVAAFTRLTRLGYAEFHEDALENMRFIVRAYKGEAYAPFLDSKGPIHWLLPAVLWYLNGWLSEGIARTPFAITSLLLIPTVYALGRRMSEGRDAIGLLAAGFVAVNGFFVAYARHVENQSLIVFWGALAMWFAYRYYKEGLHHFLLYAALALATGLITHPDVLLYLPVFAYVIWVKLRRSQTAWRRQWPWLIGASLLFVALVALFYVPYLLNPQIGLVYQYFASERIGQSFLYNRVDNMFDQDKLYSTRYHAPILVLLLTWLLARHFAQWRWPGWMILGALGLAMVSTVTYPEAWLIGNLSLAFVPYALLTLFFILLPRTDFETKTLFLWFSVPLGVLLFLAKDAADHIQVAYPAWALLSAFALADLWAWLSNIRMGTAQLALKSIVVLILTFAATLILYYQYLAFDSPVTAYWRVKVDSANNPHSIYNRLYGSIPRPRKIFSNPRLSGWKAVGYLWATGSLAGDFRSINESFAVPIWYTFQTPRSCYNDPQHYWIRRDWQGWPEEEQELTEQGYTLTRVVLVDQEPKLHLYEKNVSTDEPEILNMEDYRRQFDHLATPARFAQSETGSQSTSLDFGHQLRLHSYDLPAPTAQPGDLLPVTLYWQSLAPMEIRYRGFVHLVDQNGTLWGQHDDDPACRLLTTDMFPGQRSSRQFRLPVAPTTPPGQYQIIVGLYHPDTLERLEIWDNLSGQSVGDSIVLGQVNVK